MTTVSSITVRVPLTIRRRNGRKRMVASEGSAANIAPARTGTDPGLAKALARPHRWKRLVKEERYSSLRELAEAEKIARSHLGKMLRLTLLAPDIVEAVLGERYPDGLSTLQAFQRPRLPGAQYQLFCVACLSHAANYSAS